MNFSDFLSTENIGGWVQSLLPVVTQIILAILCLTVGLRIIKWIVSILEKSLMKSKIEKEIIPFLANLASISLKIILFLLVFGQLGFDTTILAGLLAGAGLAIGTALSGNLDNFASGILILLFKPYKSGDYIQVADGDEGFVDSVQVLNTILHTFQNEVIIVPNGNILGSTISNFTKNTHRRLDLEFGIGYGDDIDKARQIILDTCEKNEFHATDAENKPDVIVSGLGDSSVNLTLLVYCTPENYLSLKFSMLERVKKAFDEKGVSIPFPQRDVHLIKE